MHPGYQPGPVPPVASSPTRPWWLVWLVVGVVVAVFAVAATAGGVMWLLRSRESRPAAVAASARPSTGGTGTAPPGNAVVVGVDLPMQGTSADASQATVNAMKLYLEQAGGKAGRYPVALKVYDDSTAARGSWDESTCKANAAAHVADANEVAVMGTYNSGCAKFEVPVLNQDASGPMLMVSHANSNPGLTKPWEPGEPGVYYPTGKRNYARVLTTDDDQGVAAAHFAAADLGVKRCLVIEDGTVYGNMIGQAFAAEAGKRGITVVAEQPWNKRGSNSTLFATAKGSAPDCVFLGGIFVNNGAQVIRDKVATLGDNNAVKLLGPDGFVGYPDLDALPEAEGMYLTLAGASADYFTTAGGTSAAFVAAYRARYGADPATAFAVYGVQALQVILAAIEKSDGTRKGVRDAVFTGSGVTIAAGTAVLGRSVTIDPLTGAVNLRDVSLEQIKRGRETFVKVWSIT
jgi:branched-chain amino acid transport system substrate-binding protein